MKYYLAPMEGVTTYVFRNAYHQVFRPMDKYFTPFLVPHRNTKFSAREWSEICPGHNRDMYVVPQIMTNCAGDFLRTAKMLSEYGYREFNLNLGCPSRTVVSKGRGSGFLEDPHRLDEFFSEVFDRREFRISVKTRLGLDSPGEFAELLAVYEKYPLEELIIHPRVQADYYENRPDWQTFGEAAKSSRHLICYNGDLFSREDFEKFACAFPDIACVMLGRGVAARPDLVNEICGLEYGNLQKLEQFHGLLLKGYLDIAFGDRNVLFKMKEFWSYFAGYFPDDKKLWKKIKKCEKLTVYESIVNQVFRNV